MSDSLTGAPFYGVNAGLRERMGALAEPGNCHRVAKLPRAGGQSTTFCHFTILGQIYMRNMHPNWHFSQELDFCIWTLQLVTLFTLNTQTIQRCSRQIAPNYKYLNNYSNHWRYLAYCITFNSIQCHQNVIPVHHTSVLTGPVSPGSGLMTQSITAATTPTRVSTFLLRQKICLNTRLLFHSR
jgi:hypothetical protein